jgi:acetolactate synthase regulatory subunit
VDNRAEAIANDENAVLKEQLKRLKHTIAESSKEIAFLNVDVIRLEAEIAQGLIDSSQSNDTLQVILNDLRAQIDALNEKLNKLEDVRFIELTQCEKKCKIEKEDTKGKK